MAAISDPGFHAQVILSVGIERPQRASVYPVAIAGAARRGIVHAFGRSLLPPVAFISFRPSHELSQIKDSLLIRCHYFLQRGIRTMQTSSMEKGLILYFRLAMAWTFLYAASHQVFVPDWSVVGFLSHTKTFHSLFVNFTTPTMAPITTCLVEYGHLLIGLSLLTGLLVRVSASFGVFLMLTYWMAHMDWPFISNQNNFILDEHLVYAGILIFLIVTHAGHVWGLDTWAEKLNFFNEHPGLKPLVA